MATETLGWTGGGNHHSGPLKDNFMSGREEISREKDRETDRKRDRHTETETATERGKKRKIICSDSL